MKKILSIIITAALLVSTADVALSQNQDNKKFRFKKLSWDVKKEAKKLVKEGYSNVPGDIPLNQQLAKTFEIQQEVGENGYPKWLIARETASMDIESTAKDMAFTKCKVALVRLMETNIRAAIDIDLGGQETGKDVGAGLSKYIGVATERVNKKLGQVNPIQTLVRENPDGYTYRVVLAYSYQMAHQMYLDEIRNSLSEESAEVRSKYEKFLNPDLQPEVIKNTNLDAE